LDEIGIGPDDSLVQAFARHRQHAYDHGYYDGRTYDMGQPQTDALKIARERITEWCDAVADNWGQGSETHNVARDGRDIVLAALKESK
jgi:hypothetical protein